MSAIRPGGATPPRPATVHATLACTAASPECLCPSGAACLEPPAKPLPADRHQRGRWWEQPWVVAGASASPPPSAPSVSSLHAPTAPTAHTLTCDHTQASAASAGSGLLGNVSSLVTAVSLFQRAPVEQPATQTHFGGWRRHARGAPPHHSGARLGAAARPLRTVAGPFVLRGGCLRCVWERVSAPHTLTHIPSWPPRLLRCTAARLTPWGAPERRGFAPRHAPQGPAHFRSLALVDSAPALDQAHPRWVRDSTDSQRERAGVEGAERGLGLGVRVRAVVQPWLPWATPAPNTPCPVPVCVVRGASAEPRTRASDVQAPDGGAAVSAAHTRGSARVSPVARRRACGEGADAPL
jgi:hypothetical protein